jgi:hypothetical protein
MPSIGEQIRLTPAIVKFFRRCRLGPDGRAGDGPDPPHYRDHDWHAAYGSLVRAELVQAVGRGRGVLPDGAPVYAVTRENPAPADADDRRNGYPVADPGRFAPLTDAQARVLGQLYRVVPGGRQPAVGKVPEMASALRRSQQRVRALLGELRAAGRVQKVGQRGGWVAAANATRP